MPGIAIFTIEQFQERIRRFERSYVQDWDQWCDSYTRGIDVAVQFGRVLRRWQACRPNSMRRSRSEGSHQAPFLDDLIDEAAPHIQTLYKFDIRADDSFTADAKLALSRLWIIFQDLSYHGKARNGKAGIVGISKATLLLTKGRIGPALDSNVRDHLGIQEPKNILEWISVLKLVSRDIQRFEEKNATTLQKAAPQQFQQLHCGRIYDMALGPRR